MRKPPQPTLILTATGLHMFDPSGRVYGLLARAQYGVGTIEVIVDGMLSSNSFALSFPLKSLRFRLSLEAIPGENPSTSCESSTAEAPTDDGTSSTKGS
jgi:hypothetical protein